MRKLIFILCLFSFLANAQTERFNDFKATIQLNSEGDVKVSEQIRVTANGDQIERGITRPLRRASIGDDGEREQVDYKVISATRDGAPEDFHTESKRGFRTVYLGSKKRKLEPGTYSYQLDYTSDDQIYFTDNTNELRWSVFSSDLRLPVDAAAVELQLPSGLDVLTTACYTGATGSNDQSRCEVVRSGNTLAFTLNRPLAAGEGLTIAAAFPTGSFYQPPPPPPPTPLQQNGTLWASLLGILAALVYGYTNWKKYGVDPPSPPVVHQFTPPRGLSPASISYLNSGYASQTQLTASLTALAVKGYLKIEEEKRSGFLSSREIFILRPQNKAIGNDLPAEQAILYAHLCDAGDIELDGEFDERLQTATNEHNNNLSEQHRDYLKQGTNGWKVLPFALILLATVIVGVFFISNANAAGFAAFIGTILLLTAGSGIFAWLIRQPSADKVALWAEIKGMKQYLKLSEEKRRAIPGAPEMTQSYFQSILPYAIALGIENNWAADLTSDVTSTLQQDNRNNSMYMAPYLMSGFGGRMNSAYQSAASPPSSGGGGGFAGGGGGVSGGGGGSGGW
ncbi:DUF2207 domain-containing protein [Neolewinella aurantiaca]|uniref:DUF2207 domain-containing protein n=1 Tax=Neolewinella aurantiaca TaxID=2602767 RepID=A0A5C7FXF4_9BACT|nr:DUF2207 domain-containing protein [Neolewinella aurantiaca]TXF91458.1 DUF2207 domain-containing protein [Neolewinella aurantiaca]